jgi:hypothetical protein
MCALKPELKLDIIVPEDTITDDITLPNVTFLKIAQTHNDPFVNHLSFEAWDYVRRRNKQYSAVLTNLPYWVDPLNTALWERIWGGLAPRYTTPLLCVSDEWDDKELQWAETEWAKATMASILQRHRVMTLTVPDKARILIDIIPYKPTGALNHPYVITPTVYSEDVEPMIKHNDGKLRIFHGGTVPKRKRIDELIDVVGKVRGMYPNVSIILATPKELPDKYKDIDYVEYHENCTREEFKKLQYTADIAYCGPKYIGTGLAYTQNVFAGLPLLILHGDWLRGRLPDDYSFIAKGKRELEQQVAMLAEIYKSQNADELQFVNENFLNLQTYMNDNQNSVEAVDRILEHFRVEGGAAMGEATKVKHFLWDIIRENEISFTSYADFCKDVQKHIKSDKIDVRKVVTEGMYWNIKSMVKHSWK